VNVLDQEASCLVAADDDPHTPDGTAFGLGTVVGDVMLRHPKTLPAHASVEQTRAALADDHVHMVLLTEGTTLVGTLVRGDLPGGESGAGPALPWSKLASRTVPPAAGAATVQRLLIERGLRRLAVVNPEGALLGLVCLKRRRSGFCSDADVISRAQHSRTPGDTSKLIEPLYGDLDDGCDDPDGIDGHRDNCRWPGRRPGDEVET